MEHYRCVPLFRICVTNLFYFSNIQSVNTLIGYLSNAAVLHAQDNFYVFGGYTGRLSVTNVIARLDSKTYQWSMAGQLNTARNYHAAVAIDGEFLIVGGAGEYDTERCSFHEIDGELTCLDQEPTLLNYFRWPELFLVESNFCL